MKKTINLVEGHKIFDKFHHMHSTETALLRVTDDILMHADKGKYSTFIQLDLTAAFDTIDHSILLDMFK